MKNKAIKSKREKLEDSWYFTPTFPKEHEEMEMAARVAEIGMIMIFENFSYRFGGRSISNQVEG